MPEIDDRTAAYILETRPHFEDLKQVASQLAGLLVLAAAGGKTATPDHPMLAAADELYRSAAQGVRSSHATIRARRHHTHLLRATETLGGALFTARKDLHGPEVLARLRTAYDSLRCASKELPGFELLTFEHGCCARPA